MSNPLEVRNLVSRLNDDRAALDGIDLTVRHGEVLGLLGPHGSGKSHLLHCVAGWEQFDSGTIGVLGISERSAPRAVWPPQVRSRLGFASSERALFEDLTVGENLRFFGRLNRVSRDTLESRLLEVAREFRLSNFIHQRVARLPDEAAQRVHIAVSVVHEPDLLLVDEPMASFDAISRQDVMKCLVERNRSGTTILYASNRVNDINRICNRVAILSEGRIRAVGRQEDLVGLVETDEHVVVDVDRIPDGLAEALRSRVGVRACEVHDRRLVILATPGQIDIASVTTLASDYGCTVLRASIERPTLESAFFSLTGSLLKTEEQGE